MDNKRALEIAISLMEQDILERGWAYADHYKSGKGCCLTEIKATIRQLVDAKNQLRSM